MVRRVDDKERGKPTERGAREELEAGFRQADRERHVAMLLRQLAVAAPDYFTGGGTVSPGEVAGRLYAVADALVNEKQARYVADLARIRANREAK